MSKMGLEVGLTIRVDLAELGRVMPEPQLRAFMLGLAKCVSAKATVVRADHQIDGPWGPAIEDDVGPRGTA